jgi:vacuolar-type H+-ATPase subunit F/Vma7
MISPEIPSEAGTRMLFLGEDSLADGFRLIGFETHPSPSLEDTERIFRDLQRERANAFVIVDDDLMEADIPALQQVRAEGGRIVVIAIPPLAGPPRLASKVAERLATMFGNASMAR